MSTIPLNVAVVIVAEQHNPSLLHPAFLQAQRIVPEDWEPSERPLCTPPLSVVEYANGVVFSAEQQKIQVLQNEPGDLCAAVIAELTKKYVQTLPHVHHTAVGITFTVAVECENPEKIVLGGFIKEGSLALAGISPSAVQVRAAYPLGDETVLNLSLVPGKVKLSGNLSEKAVLIVTGNYHVPIPPGEGVEAVTREIGKYPERCQHFQDGVIKTLLQQGV